MVKEPFGQSCFGMENYNADTTQLCGDYSLLMPQFTQSSDANAIIVAAGNSNYFAGEWNAFAAAGGTFNLSSTASGGVYTVVTNGVPTITFEN